jgi:FkbM family methyltransferase
MLKNTMISEELKCHQPIMAVDVGSRRGLQDFWRPFLPWMTVDAFEPDEAECDKQQKTSPDNVRFVPVGLAQNTEKRTLYVLNTATGSSLYPTKPALSRYTPSSYAGLKSTVEVDCLSFSDYIRQFKRCPPNLIKLDTQGTELEILQSIEDAHWDELYAVQCEVGFQELYEGQPMFTAIDSFMRDKGFYLADLHTNRSYRCHQDEAAYYLKHKLGYAIASPRLSAELVEGEALYFRSPDEDYLYSGRERFFKFMAILAVYRYFDLALWMADEAVTRQLLPRDEADQLKQDIIRLAPRPRFWERTSKGANRLRKWLQKRFQFRPEVYRVFWLTRTWPDQ